MLIKSLFLASVLVVGVVGRASADQLGYLNEKVKLMEQSVRELQEAQRNKGAVTAETASQSEQSRVEFQSLQGSIDAVSQQMRMYMDEVNRFKQDVDERLRAVEEQARLSTSSSTAPATQPTGVPTVAGPAAMPADESTMYQKALNLVHTGDYLGAAKVFGQFVQTYPKSGLASNAQYWVGECYYAVKDYQRAIKEYQMVVERFGRSDKANTAMLKQGFAFENLGMKEESKLFLQKLVQRSPNSPEAKKAAERLRSLDAQGAKYGPAPATAPAPAQPKTPSSSNNSNKDVPLAPGVKPGDQSARLPAASTSVQQRDLGGTR